MQAHLRWVNANMFLSKVLKILLSNIWCFTNNLIEFIICEENSDSSVSENFIKRVEVVYSRSKTFLEPLNDFQNGSSNISSSPRAILKFHTNSSFNSIKKFKLEIIKFLFNRHFLRDIFLRKKCKSSNGIWWATLYLIANSRHPLNVTDKNTKLPEIEKHSSSTGRQVKNFSYGLISFFKI